MQRTPNGTTDRVPVAKITIEAPIASFRYPHFLIGRQITFEMPPPSTIYGHISSALGEYPEPHNLVFGYTFTYRSKASDYEHEWILTEPSGKKPEVKMQPHLRDFLFDCRLTLYMHPIDLIGSFRTPVFPVVLGRSQDLASVICVEETVLEASSSCYFEHTLLPFSLRQKMPYGLTVLMPRYIEPPPERRPHFESYIVLHDPPVQSADFTTVSGEDPAYWWVDPDPNLPIRNGNRRGVFLHSFNNGTKRD